MTESCVERHAYTSAFQSFRTFDGRDFWARAKRPNLASVLVEGFRFSLSSQLIGSLTHATSHLLSRLWGVVG
jgi:hypothetical protein